MPDLNELRHLEQMAKDHLAEVKADAARSVERARENLAYWSDLVVDAERAERRQTNEEAMAAALERGTLRDADKTQVLPVRGAEEEIYPEAD